MLSIVNVIYIINLFELKMPKKTTMLFKLVSSAGTGFFYVGEKHTRHAARKLQLRKYDPIVNRHVVFVEQKLKK